MGEAKRRRAAATAAGVATTQRLADEGRIIEAGWWALRKLAIPESAPEAQVREMQMAFMAGAQHLFGSIITALSDGSVETEADIRRMDMIHQELDAYTKTLKAWIGRGLPPPAFDEVERIVRPPPDEAAAPADEAPAERLGDAPIETTYRQSMNEVAAGLDAVFNGDLKGDARKVGFVLLVFKYGDHDTGRCNYISNGADRRDIVVLMKEQIARFEGQPEMRGNRLMAMAQPLQIVTDDGFETTITEQPDGSLQVVVQGMVRRSWRTERQTIQDALAVALQIRTEQATPAVAAPVTVEPKDQDDG